MTFFSLNPDAPLPGLVLLQATQLINLVKSYMRYGSHGAFPPISEPSHRTAAVVLSKKCHPNTLTESFLA